MNLIYFNFVEKLLNQPHPIPAILLEALKEYESLKRQEIVASFKRGKSSQLKPQEPLYLPFDRILFHNSKFQKELIEKKYPINQLAIEQDFISETKELLLELESLLFFSNNELDNSQNDDPNQNKVLIYFYIPKSKRKKNMIILWN